MDLVRPRILELMLLLLVLPDLLLPGANRRLCIAIDIECLLGVEVSAGVDPDILGLKQEIVIWILCEKLNKHLLFKSTRILNYRCHNFIEIPNTFPGTSATTNTPHVFRASFCVIFVKYPQVKFHQEWMGTSILSYILYGRNSLFKIGLNNQMDQQAKLQGFSPSSSSFYNHMSQVKIKWQKHTE
jgi:hypothetical protein